MTTVAPAPVDAPAPRPDDRTGSRWREAFAPRLVIRKLIGAVVSLLAVMLTSFFLFRIIPGDPVRTMTRGRPMSAGQIVALRHELGLDQPLITQFFTYVGQTLRGDLGTSFEFHTSVVSLIGSHLWPTVYLVGTATVLAALLGLWVGTRSAWRPGSLSDQVNTGIGLALFSLPSFWLGIILIVVFGVGLGPIPGMFPAGGMNTPGVTGFFPVMFDELHHLVLPAVTLIAVVYAQYLLIMRAALLDEMGSDYLTTARAKGLRDSLVRRRHAVPNALLPTITLIFIQLGQVVSGSVLVETVFSWPGLGSLFYGALEFPDFPLLQGLFLFFSAAVIVMNLLADLLYPLLDPRVRAS